MIQQITEITPEEVLPEKEFFLVVSKFSNGNTFCDVVYTKNAALSYEVSKDATKTIFKLNINLDDLE